MSDVVSLQERLGAMLNFEVVVILSKPLPGFMPGKLLPAHLDFMVALEKKGLLFLSGPLQGKEGPMGQYGLTVLNVRTIEEAQAVWADEPFFKSGQREADYFVWRLMEGELRLSLDLADRSFKLSRPEG